MPEATEANPGDFKLLEVRQHRSPALGRDARGPPRVTPRKRRRRRLLGGRFAARQAAEPGSGPGGSEPGVGSPAAGRGGSYRGPEPPPTDQGRIHPGAAVARTGASPTPTPAPGGLGQPPQAAIPLPWLPPPRAACVRQGGVVCSSRKAVEAPACGGVVCACARPGPASRAVLRGLRVRPGCPSRLSRQRGGRRRRRCLMGLPGVRPAGGPGQAGPSETLPSNEPRTPRPLCPQPGAVPARGRRGDGGGEPAWTRQVGSGGQPLVRGGWQRPTSAGPLNQAPRGPACVSRCSGGRGTGTEGLGFFTRGSVSGRGCAGESERVEAAPGARTQAASPPARPRRAPGLCGWSAPANSPGERHNTCCVPAGAPRRRCGGPGRLTRSEQPPEASHAACSSHSGHHVELLCPALRCNLEISAVCVITGQKTPKN
ncbi:translation initiation factor IF-2 [Chelonia mydas]|uniref:translation initiation factor IF-2 n=1 Tax=Chelonia mydas TaxID=8469 RepID=UPI0018A1CA85|nr:translation initiation factor IF-2 [Chelonia mydas]